MSQRDALSPTGQCLAQTNIETDRAGRLNASVTLVIYLYAGPLPLKSIVSSFTASFLASSHAYHLSVKACLIACWVLRTCEQCTISNPWSATLGCQCMSSWLTSLSRSSASYRPYPAFNRSLSFELVAMRLRSLTHTHHRLCKSSQDFFRNSSTVQLRPKTPHQHSIKPSFNFPIPCASSCSGVLRASFPWPKNPHSPWFSSTSTLERASGSRRGLGKGSLETDKGCRRPVRRSGDTPLLGFRSRGYCDSGEEEKLRLVMIRGIVLEMADSTRKSEAIPMHARALRRRHVFDIVIRNSH